MPTRGVSIFDQPDGLDRFGARLKLAQSPKPSRSLKQAEILIILKLRPHMK